MIVRPFVSRQFARPWHGAEGAAPSTRFRVLAIFLLLASSASAATIDVVRQGCPASAEPPVACSGTTGRCYTDTDDNTVYFCIVGSWTEIGGSATPGGSDGQVQYNNNGVFGGVSGLTLSAGTLSGVDIAGFGLSINTASAPDIPALYTNTTSNSISIMEEADRGFNYGNGNCGASPCTHPTLHVRSRNQNTAQWGALYHDAQDFFVHSGQGDVNISTADANHDFLRFSQATHWLGRVQASNGGNVGATVSGDGVWRVDGSIWLSTDTSARHVMAGPAKALTESSATAVVNVGVPSNSATGGDLAYTVTADDGADFQSRSGRVSFQAVNKAGAETCVISGFDGTNTGSGTVDETKDGSALAASTGTLTYAWTTSTTPTNACQFLLTAVSSLTQTTLNITFQVHRNAGTGAIARQ